jgi:hypothetical protein
MTARSAVLPPRPAPLDTFWRATSSRPVSLLLVVFVCLSLVLSSLVPQLPPEAAESTAGRARWFANTVSSLGSLGAPLRALGFLDIAHAPWWRILLALCFFHVSLILADEGRRAWRLSRRLPLAFPARFVSSPASLNLSATREGASRALHRYYGPVVVTERDGAVILYAARRPGAAWARPLVCAGLLFILIWVLAGERFSWRDARLVLPPAEAVALTQAPPWELRLANENPSRLAFAKGGQVVAERTLAAGSPARYQGISVHLLGDGPALIVRGHKTDGQPLALQSITAGRPATYTLALAFDQPHAERTFAVPLQRIAFRLIASPGNPIQAEVYRSDSDTPFLRTTVAGTSTIEVEGARYDFTPARYLLITAVYEPTFPLMTLGGILILTGILLGFSFPTRVAWVRLWPDAQGTNREVAAEHLGWVADDGDEGRLLARTLSEYANGS